MVAAAAIKPETAPHVAATARRKGSALGDEESDRSKVVPFPSKLSRVLAEVGGPVGEVGVALAIYGEELDPGEITRTLGVAPTKAHRRGERPKRRSDKRLGSPHGPESPPFKTGEIGATMEFDIYAYGDDE
jgi:hypothetical protein